MNNWIMVRGRQKCSSKCKEETYVTLSIGDAKNTIRPHLEAETTSSPLLNKETVNYSKTERDTGKTSTEHQ